MVSEKIKKKTGLMALGWVVEVRGNKSKANVTIQCRVPLCQNHEELIQSKQMLKEADHRSTDAYSKWHAAEPDLVIMDKRKSIRPLAGHNVISYEPEM